MMQMMGMNWWFTIRNIHGRDGRESSNWAASNRQWYSSVLGEIRPPIFCGRLHYPPLKLTVRTWKWMIGRLNFLLGWPIFRGELLVSGRVHFDVFNKWVEAFQTSFAFLEVSAGVWSSSIWMPCSRMMGFPNPSPGPWLEGRACCTGLRFFWSLGSGDGEKDDRWIKFQGWINSEPHSFGMGFKGCKGRTCGQLCTSGACRSWRKWPANVGQDPRSVWIGVDCWSGLSRNPKLVPDWKMDENGPMVEARNSFFHVAKRMCKTLSLYIRIYIYIYTVNSQLFLGVLLAS